MLSIVVVFNCCMSVSAVTGITDVFGDDYVDYDVNIDGFFNIKDLVRAKKYYAGIPVSVNMNFVASSSAQVLVSLRKELLRK